MKVINLWAGPGAGKSTTRAMLFAKMKLAGLNVEEVTEYAKDLTWENNISLLGDQLLILANQNRKLERLRGKVEFVVSDAPILLSMQYASNNFLPKTFQSLMMELWDTYDNINFFVERVKPYSPVGRNQTEDEAKKIDTEIKDLLRENNISFRRVIGDNTCADQILRFLQEDLRI